LALYKSFTYLRTSVQTVSALTAWRSRHFVLLKYRSSSISVFPYWM